MKETWVKYRSDDTIPFSYPTYSPIDLETGVVLVGLGYIGDPEGEIVGECWYENGKVMVELYTQECRKSNHSLQKET